MTKEICMKNKWIKSIPVLAAILLPAPLYAAPVTYDESVSGDLGFDASFLLEPTANYISGSISSGSSSDFDSFYITIPENFKAAFTFSSSFDTAGSPYGVSFSWELNRLTTSGDCSIVCMHSYTPYASQVFASSDDVGFFVTPAGDLNLSSIPFLSSGSYLFKQIGSAGSAVPWDGEPWSNYLHSMNYTASFDLQPVPIPGAFYLFGTGLVALGAASRKKR
jgi:hypothetical protein